MILVFRQPSVAVLVLYVILEAEQYDARRDKQLHVLYLLKQGLLC
jgi:hypothetical protein